MLFTHRTIIKKQLVLISSLRTFTISTLFGSHQHTFFLEFFIFVYMDTAIIVVNYAEM